MDLNYLFQCRSIGLMRSITMPASRVSSSKSYHIQIESTNTKDSKTSLKPFHLPSKTNNSTLILKPRLFPKQPAENPSITQKKERYKSRRIPTKEGSVLPKKSNSTNSKKNLPGSTKTITKNSLPSFLKKDSNKSFCKPSVNFPNLQKMKISNLFNCKRKTLTWLKNWFRRTRNTWRWRKIWRKFVKKSKVTCLKSSPFWRR